jgi:hypothetical protein
MTYPTSESFWFVRTCFERGMAFMYANGFLIIINQFRGVVGEHGLLPARGFIKRVRFWDAPSIFWLNCSDRAFLACGWVGLVLSLLALFGLTERFGLAAHMLSWFVLWLLYLSFANMGQTFYGFGWEILIQEAGFLTIFLGPTDLAPPATVIWLLRWLAFRLMFGAGLIKLRYDKCWWDLTCLYYHYETQPLPNPLSRRFHSLPKPVHRLGVLFNHFVEIVVPWGFFCPAPISDVTAVLTILFQVILILSGNLSWLNHITIVVALSGFDDQFLSLFLPVGTYAVVSFSPVLYWIAWAVTALVAALSIRPALNLVSEHQSMNRSYDPLNLVNSYGAFGTVTRQRLEIVIQGTDAEELTADTQWRDYEFKAKPGDVRRRPRIVSPYQLHLDWQM